MTGHLTGLCPGCGHMVPLLAPRPIQSRSRTVRPWKRRDHTVKGSAITAGGPARCRWTRVLTPNEIPEGAPTP